MSTETLFLEAVADREGPLENLKWTGTKRTSTSDEGDEDILVETPKHGSFEILVGFTAKVPPTLGFVGYCGPVALEVGKAVAAVDFDFTDSEQDFLFGEIPREYVASARQLFAEDYFTIFAEKNGENKILSIEFEKSYWNADCYVSVRVEFGLDVIVDGYDSEGGGR